MPEQQTEETDRGIVAYYYESRNTDYGGGWKPGVTEYNPREIINIELRNLQRLIPASKADHDAEVVALQYDLEHWDGSTATHVDRANIVDNDKVENIVPLVPIEEDVNEGPQPEPVRNKGFAKYFKHADEEKYYRVETTENEAEVWEDGEINDELIWTIWVQFQHDQVEETHYEDTPFSEPKFNPNIEV